MPLDCYRESSTMSIEEPRYISNTECWDRNMLFYFAKGVEMGDRGSEELTSFTNEYMPIGTCEVVCDRFWGADSMNKAYRTDACTFRGGILYRSRKF